MKIAYCGYDFFSACLQDLLAHDFNVQSVFTMECDNRLDFNQYIYEIATEHALPVDANPIDAQTIRRLDAEGYDLLITAGYRYKVPDLTGTRLRGINVHPTLLPVGRGPFPLPWIVLKGLNHSGVTIHALTQEFDAGNVLAQASFAVSPQENLESLSAKCQLRARALLHDVVANIDHYWKNQRPQQGHASYWRQPRVGDRTIDWHESVDDIDRKCRAFGKSGVRSTFAHQDWWVYGLTAWKEDHGYRVGEVVHRTNTEMIVAAADGLVDLLYFRRVEPPAAP